MKNSRYVKVLTYIFGAVITVVALLLIISSFPIPGNYKIMIVQSGSMEPTIKTGSIVAVKPTDSYKIGDVITFGPVSKTRIPTTHRITDVRLQEGVPVYVTKGDANDDEDSREVLSRDVIGKVYVDVPYLGYALAAAKKPVGFAILIIVPALLIIIDEVRKIVREVKKRKLQAS